MDYEKKYNDALALAKSYYGKGTNEYLDTIFPELTESEDERIRKALLGLTYLDGIEPILTKCSITRREIRAYLEKQKENPKNANSIPADCVSNAKCPYKIHGEGEFVGDIRDTPAYWRGWDDAMKQSRNQSILS